MYIMSIRTLIPVLYGSFHRKRVEKRQEFLHLKSGSVNRNIFQRKPDHYNTSPSYPVYIVRIIESPRLYHLLI